MKRWLVLAVAAITMAAFSTVSFAAIQGSHHDMAAYTGQTNKDACYACHGIKAETTSLTGGGVVGTLCYLRCHSGLAGNQAGTGIQGLAGSNPEYGFYDNGAAGGGAMVAQTYTVGAVSDKYTGGHGFLAGATNILAPDTAAMVTATGWPYVGDASLQCTSCHDVHSNVYTPFVRAPLSDNVNQANAFCQKCHAANGDGTARWVTITAAPNGSHPSEVDFSGAATRNSAGRYGRTIYFKDTVAGDNSAIFRNVSPWGTALNVPANSYNPGGKLGAPQGVNTFNSATAGVVGCYTCHATHLPPTTGVTPAATQLIVAPYKGRAQSDLCIGCHGGNAAKSGAGLTAANPGVTSYYHPVDGDSRPVNVATPATSTWQVTTGAFNITVNLDNGGVAAPLGVGGRLLCASCHTGNLTATAAGVHYGPAGTMLLNPRKPTCESCHNTTAAVYGLTANSHHVYGGGAAEGTRFGGYGYPGSVTYNASFTANLADGLQCNDCHVFNNTAHNWN